LGDGDEAARFVEVVDQTSFARVVAVACFVGEGVAVPAVDVLAAVVLGVERALLLLDPRRAGAEPWGRAGSRAGRKSADIGDAGPIPMMAAC